MDLIFTVVLPLLAVAVFALLGMMRGARREAYVSGAIALAALLVNEWAVRWGEDLNNLISGFGRGNGVFYLSLAIMALSVLVIGYGLGSSVVKGAPTGTSRALGLVLGALNGAAFAGYLLRVAFIFLDNSSGSSAIYTNPVSYWLIFWAGWYPVALATIAAVVALVRAFAGGEEAKVAARTATTPSLAEPPAAPSTYSGYAAGGPSPARAEPSSQTTVYVPPPPSSPPATSASQTTAEGYSNSPLDDAWRTTAPDLAAHRGVDSQSWADSLADDERSRVKSQPPVAADVSGPMTTIPTGEAKYHTPPFGMPAVTGGDATEAPITSSETAETGTAENPAETKVVPVGSTTAAVPQATDSVSPSACRVCGSPLKPGQLYCTECGTKVES